MASMPTGTSRSRSRDPHDVALSAAPGAALQAAAPAGRGGVNALDVFFVVNGALFLLMCVFAYYDRWTAYMGSGRLTEFLFYAAVILVAMAVIRVLVPRRPVAAWLLVLVQVGIVAHFSGGLVHFGGMRLYDHVYGGIRFDKFVHAYNAFVGGLAVLEVCRLSGIPVAGITRCLAFFSVLGLGAIVEISEYAVTRTLPEHGVGGYADTSVDLIANACGGLLFLSFGGWLEKGVDRWAA